jgi:putrescine transport system ATP-binding protein
MANPDRTAQAIEPWKDPQAEPYLRIENVTKKFGDFTAVNRVSLDIYKGEVFCLLGGSGCGKSTLLRMLAGFESLSEGRVFIDGVDMAGIPPFERPVNMMFQSYALFPHMNVEKNVGFGLRQDGLPAAEIHKRVADMLQLVKLETFARRKPHQLSGGQRQRVALARSLIKQPKLLLLDEPLGALDKKLREETQFELINIQEELGVTFVVVTHDQEEAMTLSSRIGVMDAGEIVQTGTPTQIYEYPNSRFVADFIGSVNLFDGRVIEDEADHLRVESAEAGCTLYIDHGVSTTPDARVWVAVRPEKIEISRGKPSQEENCASAVVDEIAYLGGISIYHVVLDSGKKLRITRPNRERDEAGRITWGDHIYVYWKASSALVLVT